MNMNLDEGLSLAKGIVNSLKSMEMENDLDVVLIPPFIHLNELNGLLKDSRLALGAQNVHKETSGAFTGEVSASMVKSVGVDYCLVGHSERRVYQQESDDELIAKVNQLLKEDIQAIFCVGESLEERESGKEKEVIADQLAVLFDLDESDFSNLIIAYEPVWAIGTGKTASSDQAQEMHAHIRAEISNKYGSSIADEIRILYGGSCKPDNAAELFSKKDVDGGLIGGASLDADSFVEIIKAASWSF